MRSRTETGDRKGCGAAAPGIRLPVDRAKVRAVRTKTLEPAWNKGSSMGPRARLCGKCGWRSPDGDGPCPSGCAERARKNRIDVPRVIGFIEQRLDLVRAEPRRDPGVSLEIVDKPTFAAPGGHRAALDEGIGVLARDALLGQGEQNALRMNEAAEAVEIFAHPFRIDDEIFDDARKAMQREIKMDRRVRANPAFNRGMGNIALVPERHILHGRDDAHAHQTRKAGEIFGQHRVALVRHRRGAFLAGREILLGFENLRPLKMAYFGCKALDRRGDDAERSEESGVPVARNDLRRDRLDRQAHFPGDMRLNRRIDIGEGADRAGDRANGDFLPSGDKAPPRAPELGVMARELDAKGRRLGVDPVAAPDRQGHLVLEGAFFQRGEHAVSAGDEKIARARELHRKTGVEDVRRRHSLMNEARLRPDDFGKMGEERDDVMLDLALDRIDARHVEARAIALRPDRLGGGLRDDAKRGHPVCGVRLDFKPDPEPRFRRPDGDHFLAGVAGDHRGLSKACGRGYARKAGLSKRGRPGCPARLGERRLRDAPKRRQSRDRMTQSALDSWTIADPAIRLALPPMSMPASGRRWVLRDYAPATAIAIAAATGCPPEIARLLAARGLSAGAAPGFLNPSLKRDLPDPSVLTDIDRAAARLADAIAAGETCGVFGDYDVDGTCGAAILKLYFSAAGGQLEVYLPDRLLEGYGPTIEAFRVLKEKGARLIVTVDCGASAHQAIGEAAAEGISIIVLDHHQMDGPPPAGAYATVNPNRTDDNSGLALLSAAGVVFMAIVAINRSLRARGWFASRPEPDLRSFLDLTALGLVCDVMPMTGLARVLTAQGLKVLSGEGNPGLKELGARAGMKGEATSFDLGFLLGPRINAAGRIGHARLAFELLTTDDPARRAMLADKLHVMNAERQAIERSVQEEAIALIEQQRLYERAVIVAAGEGWHQGVVGIVAGRLKDRYHRPAIVIGIDSGVGKGSARSLTGVDLGAAVRAARHEGLLIAGGGHAMAAGLTIDAARLAEFGDFLERTLRADVDRAVASQRLDIDALVAPTAVAGGFARMLNNVGPFGPGNPEPVFALASMTVERAKVVGEAHVACDLSGAGGERVRAIAFRAEGEALGALLKSGRRLHLAGRIKADSWRGGEAAQFQIVDAAQTMEASR